MKPPHTLWFLIGSFLVPLIAIAAVLFAWLWRMRRKAGIQPIGEKLLRPPGESLRRKMDELGDRLGERMSLAFMVPAIAMAVILLSSTDGILTPTRVLAAFAVCAALLMFFLRRAFITADELRDHRLGFHGERAVGEELNQLMLDGCRVFHDVPMEPYGNIDHVVVSTCGVFAIETKTRRKRPAPEGKSNYKAVFDGEGVQFPTWREVEMVEQARRQGTHLRTFLTKAVGETVNVQPILTLPGWYVTSKVPRDGIQVLNPGLIAKVAADSSAAKLTPQMIQRIAHQLDQKCRDVEL